MSLGHQVVVTAKSVLPVGVIRTVALRKKSFSSFETSIRALFLSYTGELFTTSLLNEFLSYHYPQLGIWK